MHMNRTFLAIIFSLAAGFAAGAWTTVATPPSGSQGDSRHTAGAFDAAAPLEDRIAALEQAVSGERDARLVLEEQLHEVAAAYLPACEFVESVALEDWVRLVLRKLRQDRD